MPKPSSISPPPKPAKAAAPHEVRLIGGRWKRSKLPVPDRPGLRPTPDRVRETLFNWLGQDLSGWRVLDAFAGTGALGFEAASRGAAAAVLLERDPSLVAALHASRARLGAVQVTVQRADALTWMNRASTTADFDLVMLDPPFGLDLFEAALQAALQVLQPTGLIYLESDRDWPAAVLAPLGLMVRRSGRAGMVHYFLLERLKTPLQE
ncbi:16S rRNA (guanine(966)-N(2))-methyltransferase RsmD [Leptothrix ochracea]|uniref:16S rRNA (guanine(966)-N(2))-methyltransferase RsmD n=1 Tax=Leptothrix ochracea TaxID=735331 RepID=UPI0034E2BAFB